VGIDEQIREVGVTASKLADGQGTACALQPTLQIGRQAFQIELFVWPNIDDFGGWHRGRLGRLTSEDA
jgi:hypothetical protein